MFDWLGLSAEATRILGWVFIGIAIVLIIFLIFFALQIVRDMRRTQLKLENLDKATDEKQKNIEKNNEVEIKNEQKVINKVEQKATQQEVEKPKEQKIEEKQKEPEKDIIVNAEKSNEEKAEQKIEKAQDNVNNYVKSLNLLNNEQKDIYTDVKNLYFSFPEIENNLITDAETFSYNKKVIGLITVKNSIPVLYQKLSNPELTEKFSTDEVSYNKYKKIPIQYILENSQINNAINSIEQMTNELQLTKSKIYKPKKFKNLIEF